jgi:hypothetical protein
MNLASTHIRLIAAFTHHKVEFLIMGGHAAIYYGSERTTSDLDLLVLPGKENGKRILSAFQELGLEAAEINASDFEEQLVLSFGEKPEEVDILNYLAGLDIRLAFSRKTVVEVDGFSVPLIDYRDLLRNKLSLNRKDLKGFSDQQDIWVLRKKMEVSGDSFPLE